MRIHGVLRVATLGLAAALAVGGAALEAKNPQTNVGADVGGRYTLPDGYVRLAVDGYGRVEGYFERGGVFGQVEGVLQGSRFEGYWTSEATDQACASPRRDSSSWGRLSLEFLSADEFVGMAGACGASPDGAERWNGQRR